MQVPDDCSPAMHAQPQPANAEQSTAPARGACGARAACREFWRETVAAGTTLLAISTSIVGVVLLMIILLMGADEERSIELRAARYGLLSQQRSRAMSNITNQDRVANHPTASAVDTLRWIRTAALCITALGLMAIVGNLMYQRRPIWDRRLPLWPGTSCARLHRHDADSWQAIRATLGTNVSDLVGNRLTVRQVMSPTTPLGSPGTSIRALKNMLALRPQSLVAICDSTGRLLGVVDDADLRRRGGKCAADVMTCEPYTAPPGARLDAAVTLMLDHQLHCLPIVEDGVLRGMLTIGDLMVALDCVLQAIREVSTTSVAHNTDTQTFHAQGTRRIPPAPTGQHEPPDTIQSPTVG